MRSCSTKRTRQNLFELFLCSVKAYVSGMYGPENVWIWLETYPATWWHDTNTTQNEIMKTVVQYSFGFGDNINIQDNTTNTISGRVSVIHFIRSADSVGA